jgi:hypothetical protein
MEAQQDDARGKRRRPLRFLFRTALGLAALCTGAFVVLLFFLPTLVSPLAASFLRGYLGGRYQGRFEIEGLRLAWFSRQTLAELRLYDPDGGEVGVASGSAPSLVDLIQGAGRDLGTIELQARLALVVDDAGLSNLERCLAPLPKDAPAREPRREIHVDRRAPPALSVRVELACEELSFSDVHTRASGVPFVLRDLRGLAQLAPGEPLALELEGAVHAAEPGVLRARARIDDPFRITDAEQPTPFHVDCEVSGLPTALVDTLAGQGGLLLRVLGPDFRFMASGSGTSASGSLSLELESEHLQLAFAGRVADGVLATDGDSGATTFGLDLGPEWVEELTAGLLAGADAADAAETPSLFPRPAQRLEVAVDELALPLAPLFAPAPERGDLAGALLRGLTVHARVRAGDWIFRATDLRRLQLCDVGAEVRVAAGDASGARPFELGLGAALASQPATADLPPNVELTLGGPDLTMLAGWRPGAALAPVHVRGVARELETALLEPWLGPGGARLRAQGPRVAGDLTLDLVQPAGGALEARFDVGFTTDAGACRLAGDARVADATGFTRAGPWPELELSAGVEGLAPLLALLPAGASGPRDPRPLLGERVELRASHVGRAPSSGKLELDLETQALSLDLEATLEDAVLRFERGRRLMASLAPPPELVASLLSPHLPAGAELACAPGGRIELVCDELALDLSPWLAVERPSEPAAALLWRGLEGRVTLRAPALAFTPAPDAEGAVATPPIELLEATLELACAAGEPARARLSGSVVATPPGTLELDVGLPDLAEALSTGTAPRLVLRGRATGLPTAPLDRLAAQDGLLLDVLGPALDLELAGEWPPLSDRPLSAHMRSSQAELTLVARLDQGVLVAGPDGALDASLQLTPLFTQRVVGNLLPMLVHLSQPEGAAPSVLELRGFQLPLDGDLRRLSGQIRVDLSEVDYSLLPGLDGLVSKLGSGAAEAAAAVQALRRADLRPFELEVERGVVRVDALPLVLRGQELAFSGGYDLVLKRYNLATELPLSLLGPGFEKKLDKLREYLDPGTKVPIDLKGTFSAPKLRLGEGFLDKALESAGKQALERGVSGLLEKLKGDG